MVPHPRQRVVPSGRHGNPPGTGQDGRLRERGVTGIQFRELLQVPEHLGRTRPVTEQEPHPEDRPPEGGAAVIVHRRRGAQVIPRRLELAELRGQAVGEELVGVHPVRPVLRRHTRGGPLVVPGHLSAEGAQRAAARRLGLVEASDVGHRLNPPAPVLDVHLPRRHPPPCGQVVEQAGGTREVVQFGGRHRRHEHRFGALLTARQQFEGEGRVLRGQQLGHAHGGAGARRGKAQECLLELEEARHRLGQSPAAPEERVDEPDGAQRLVLRAHQWRPEHQRRDPCELRDRQVGSAAGQRLGPAPQLGGNELDHRLLVGELLAVVEEAITEMSQ